MIYRSEAKFFGADHVCHDFFSTIVFQQIKKEDFTNCASKYISK